MRERSSGRGGNPADVGPCVERTRPCGAILTGGDVVAAQMEEVGDLVVGGLIPAAYRTGPGQPSPAQPDGAGPTTTLAAMRVMSAFRGGADIVVGLHGKPLVS